MTVTSLSPTGKSTGTSTLPSLSVVAVTFVPSGNVTITVALAIGSPVTSSVTVTLTLVSPTVLLVTSASTSLSRGSTWTGTVVCVPLYVSSPGYVTVISLSPTGKSTGTSTFPSSSVVAVMFVPSGNVTITVALLIGSSVTESVSVTLTLVSPTVLFVTFAVSSDSLPTISTSGNVLLLAV